MRREYRFAISAASAAVIAVFAAAPETFWTQLPALCVWRAAFEMECLGCGLTRALAAAAHGDLRGAVDLNRGVLVAAPALLLGVAAGFWRRP
jgi:hypothetical protein